MAADGLPVVHAVTDDDVLAREDALDRLRGVMRALGARGALHLRGPHTAAARLFHLAVPLAAEQLRGGAWLVVNDRVDLAAGARAAQLTSRSLSVRQARALTPATTLRLGASVHGAVEAGFASKDGADWIVTGHVFETPSHPGVPGRGLGHIREVLAATTTPVIAIGGVLPEHVHMLRAAGAYGIAAIRGIWGEDDAAAAAQRYLSTYDDASGSGPD